MLKKLKRRVTKKIKKVISKSKRATSMEVGTHETALERIQIMRGTKK